MSRHLLKYNLVNDFKAEQGDGDVVTTVTPGVAYITENKDTCYNNTTEPEPEPQPDPEPEPEVPTAN